VDGRPCLIKYLFDRSKINEDQKKNVVFFGALAKKQNLNHNQNAVENNALPSAMTLT